MAEATAAAVAVAMAARATAMAVAIAVPLPTFLHACEAIRRVELDVQQLAERPPRGDVVDERQVDDGAHEIGSATDRFVRNEHTGAQPCVHHTSDFRLPPLCTF